MTAIQEMSAAKKDRRCGSVVPKQFDAAALRGVISQVTADARKALVGFRVKTRWLGGARSETSVDGWELAGERRARQFRIASDEPTELLGTNTAPNPQEILMAAMNACMMVGYVACSAMKGIEVESVEIETDGELDLRGFLGIEAAVKPGYDEVRYTVRIRGNGTREQFEEVHRTVMQTSPNYFNVSQPVRIVPTLVVE